MVPIRSVGRTFRGVRPFFKNLLLPLLAFSVLGRLVTLLVLNRKRFFLFLNSLLRMPRPSQCGTKHKMRLRLIRIDLGCFA